MAGISSTGSLQPLPHPRHSIPHYQELSVAGVRPLYPRATTFTCHATGRQRGTPTLVPHAQTCRGSAAVTATHSALTLEIRVEFQVRTQMCLSRSTRKRGNRCYEIWYDPMSRMRYQTPRSMFAFPAAKTGHTLIAVWTMTGSKSPYSGSNNHSGVHHLGHYKLWQCALAYNLPTAVKFGAGNFRCFCKPVDTTNMGYHFLTELLPHLLQTYALQPHSPCKPAVGAFTHFALTSK